VPAPVSSKYEVVRTHAPEPEVVPPMIQKRCAATALAAPQTFGPMPLVIVTTL
jgi:hypothetical protein